jgi:hypothetical protein
MHRIAGRLDDRRRRLPHGVDAVDLVVQLGAAQARPTPRERPRADHRQASARHFAHGIGDVVVAEPRQDLAQLRRRRLAAKALPRVVVAEHDRLLDRQVGDLADDFCVLVTEVADEQCQVGNGALEVDGIRVPPPTVHVADHRQGRDRLGSTRGQGRTKLAADRGRVSPVPDDSHASSRPWRTSFSR